MCCFTVEPKPVPEEVCPLNARTKKLKFKSKNLKQISTQSFMKKIITSLCLGFMLIFAAMPSKAATYYVLDGQEFNLLPQVGNSLFSSILWTVDGVALPILTDKVGKFTRTFNLPSNNNLVPATHKLTLGVIEELSTCISEVVEHTIVVLPKVTLSITTTGDKDNFCVGAFSTELTLKANVDLAALKSSFNIVLSPSWTGPKTGTGSTLAINAAGDYTVNAEYSVLTGTDVITNAIVPAATKILGAVTGATKTISNNLALPSVPSLVLN